MGANFAPSYANLAMGLWELEYVSDQNPFASQVVYYRRYIDDIIIWDGSIDSGDKFLSYCNTNSLGISFSHVTDPEKLAFLDLELCHDGTTIHASNYVKPTASNSFIHYRSCHLRKWINNIPKSQFHRIQNNCTRGIEFDSQGELLSTKFLEKGYPPPLVSKAFEHYKNPPQKEKNGNNQSQIMQFTIVSCQV